MTSLESPYDEGSDNSFKIEKGDDHVVEELNAMLEQKKCSPGDHITHLGSLASLDLRQDPSGIWCCSLNPVFSAIPPFKMSEGILELLTWSVFNNRGQMIATGTVGDGMLFDFHVGQDDYPFSLKFDWPK